MTKITPSTEESTEVASPQTINPNIDKILQRLDNLESENKSLQDKLDTKNTLSDGKKRYEWPRHYSFKLWAGLPVLDYVSEKKDPSRELVYKNQYGEYTENQLVKLTLLKLDGKTESRKVLITSFNDWFSRSEKMEAKVESDGSKVTAFEFNTKEFWKFKVNYKVIN